MQTILGSLMTNRICFADRNFNDAQFQKAIKKKLTKKIEADEVEDLELDANRLTEKAVKVIATYSWNNLVLISFGNNQIGNKGCRIITKIPLHSLKTLFLDQNGIEDVGLTHLVKANFKSLKELFLGKNHWSSQSVAISKANWNIVSLYFCFDKDEDSGILNFFSCQNIMIFMKNHPSLKFEQHRVQRWQKMRIMTEIKGLSENNVIQFL